MGRLVVSLLLFFTVVSAWGQSTYQPLNSRFYHYLDRLEIRTNSFASGLHTTHKPFSRQALTNYANRFDTMKVTITGLDRYNIYKIYKDNAEWAHRPAIQADAPLFKYFYRNKADFYHTSSDSFLLKINPVIYGTAGKELRHATPRFRNTRGVKIRGWIDKKVGFYSSITENQAYYPTFVQNRIQRYNAVPHQGFYKPYKAFFTPEDSTAPGVDYLDAQGYITTKATDHISLQFGYGRNFIGNGHRSLFLSNYSNNYLFLKSQTNIWRLEYTNLFTQFAAQHYTSPNILVPKKYGAFHHLSWNITDHVNLGLFEGIIFHRSRFEINYLNPVIFYRSVEQELGSADNALAGLDWKVNFLNHFSWYGQILLDEWRFYELIQQSGWWGNKQGFQTGLKYIDVAGVDNLDAQIEFNTVRPYTYSYHDSLAEYSHYNQPLAHPLGANFYEWLGKVQYQPAPKWFIKAKVLMATKGTDTTGTNWGGNIFKPYTTREQSYNNKLLQGVKKQLQVYDVTVSYELWHNLFIDLRYLHRQSKGAIPHLNMTTDYISMGARLNITQQQFDY